MANLNLSPREWDVLVLALKELLHVEAVIDADRVTLAEFNHVFDKVMNAKKQDDIKRRDEDSINTTVIAFEDDHAKNVHQFNRRRVQVAYNGPERRKQ